MGGLLKENLDVLQKTGSGLVEVVFVLSVVSPTHPVHEPSTHSSGVTSKLTSSCCVSDGTCGIPELP